MEADDVSKKNGFLAFGDLFLSAFVSRDTVSRFEA